MYATVAVVVVTVPKLFQFGAQIMFPRSRQVLSLTALRPPVAPSPPLNTGDEPQPSTSIVYFAADFRVTTRFDSPANQWSLSRLSPDTICTHSRASGTIRNPENGAGTEDANFSGGIEFEFGKSNGKGCRMECSAIYCMMQF